MASLPEQGFQHCVTHAPSLPVDLLHHDFVAYVTDLEIALELGIDARALHRAVDQLLDRISQELVAEERLMRRIAYPDSDIHLEAHRILVGRLESAFGRCAVATDHRAVDSLIGCVRSWLSHHRATMDAPLADYAVPH